MTDSDQSPADASGGADSAAAAPDINLGGSQADGLAAGAPAPAPAEDPAGNAADTATDDAADIWAAALAEQAAATPPAPAEAPAPQPAAAAAAPSAPAAGPPAAAAATPVSFPSLSGAGGTGEGDLSFIKDIPVQLTVELGRTRMTIKNLLQLGQGSVVELDGLAGEPMDIFVNGFLIAQGEVVVVEDRYGIRLTDIITPADRLTRLNGRR